MKFKLTVLLSIGLILGGVMGALIAWNGNPSVSGTPTNVRSQPPIKGLRITGFELKSLENETIRLEQYRGIPVVINFWATWCIPCRLEMPLLQQLYTQK
ncbi:MAG: TlpA disulfide reductase family protein, partial [Anaerolineaceae bacterium]|nr:TlpA disulfide reductase family protein [Anaerolineaceae bacterium]